MKRNYIFVFSAILLLTISACKKDEGYGGRSTIKGSIFKKTYNKEFNVLQSLAASAEERVYLFFGDNSFYGDDTRTSGDGTFEFNYLQAGDYTIMYYSEDSTLATRGQTIAKYKKVTVGSKSTSTADSLYVLNSVNYDKGTSSITGKIYTKNYTKNYGVIIDTTAAQDWDVYLVYNNRTYYDSRIRTLYDGTYTFPGLIKGHYKIYTYSEDNEGSKTPYAIVKEIDVTEENQNLGLAKIYVNHENY